MTELVYGVISPVLAAILPREGAALLDSAAVSIADKGVVLSGSGKSSTMVSLMAKQGSKAISEDSCLIDAALQLYGRKTLVRVALADTTGARRRTGLEANWPWTSAVSAATLVRLYPGSGAARVWDASPIDAMSWIGQAVSSRALGFGSWLPTEQLMSGMITHELVSWSRIQAIVLNLVTRLRVIGCAGDLDGFADVLLPELIR